MVVSQRSKVFITSGVIFAVVAFVVLLIAANTRRPETVQKKITITPEDKRNILVTQEERMRIIRDFNHRVGKRSNAQMMNTTGITYTLSAEFEQRVKPKSKPKNVLAVSTICNISDVPDSVYVHDLKGHLLEEDARVLARQYGVESISYSQQTETTAFQYLYIRPDNTASFTMYEPSGVYTYTNASKLAAGTLMADNLRRYANQILAAHKLDENLSVPQFRTFGEVTDFTYRRNLLDFMLVDEASIQSFFDQENCSVSDSDIMGLITTSVKNNGEIVKLINNTRSIIGTFKMPTISIGEAIVQYKDAQPLDPLVFPAGVELDVSRQVVLDAAVIAYYDVGLNFAQNLYIPLYIAHGFGKSTTGQDVQILTFFPAVSADSLVNKGLIRVVPEPGDRATQQQGTFGFSTPTPHAPPPFAAPKPEFGTSGPGCPSSNIGYMVSCSVEGNIICRGQFSGTAAADTMTACTAGCSDKVTIVDVTGGTNPCDAIMKENGVTADKINGEVPRQRVAPRGEVSCVITACPT